jgi:Ca-activated chloride channel family protein
LSSGPASNSVEPSSDSSGGDADGPIVVLSDGATNVGVPNDTAAQEASDARVPVNTIAFGTPNGTVNDPSGQPVVVPVNSAALTTIAQQTGQALTAQSADELRAVFAELGAAVNRHPVTKEVGDWFAGTAFTLLALAGISSLAWFSRLP